jgi:integrase
MAFGRAFGKTLHRITDKELRSYCNGFKSSRTKNNHLNYIKTFFRWAQKEKYVPQGELQSDRVRPFEEDEDAIEKDVYDVIFTPEELEKLLAAADNDLMPTMAIGAFAGVRTCEISKLVWEEIDLDQKVIEIKKSKSKVKRRRMVTMTDNLVAWLKTFKGERKGRLIPPAKNWIYNKRADACDRAAIDWKDNGLRKGYISYRMAEADSDAYQVAKHCGNSPTMVENTYKQLVKPNEATKWFSIIPKKN